MPAGHGTCRTMSKVAGGFATCDAGAQVGQSNPPEPGPVESGDQAEIAEVDDAGPGIAQTALAMARGCYRHCQSLLLIAPSARTWPQRSLRR